MNALASQNDLIDTASGSMSSAGSVGTRGIAFAAAAVSICVNGIDLLAGDLPAHKRCKDSGGGNLPALTL